MDEVLAVGDANFQENGFRSFSTIDTNENSTLCHT